MIESTLLIWGFALLGAALLLLVVELFIPSGGIIGVTALIVTIAGVVVFWRVSTLWGIIATATVIVLAPVTLNFMLKIMPSTPVGKRMFLSDDPDATAAHERALAELREQEQALVGAVGSAITELRPVGLVEIEGTRIEVLAEGGVIDAGRPVRVTSVEGKQVRVRAI